ncbi:MAG TPA: hypothetical protein VHW69_06295, partial [Rhizomicrobium sp.]|nr:hypothetical protein [Rhizomicrobium sp.]
MDEMTLREFEKFKLFMRIQADYGKWLAATIAVLQSGALFALGEGKFPHAPRCAYLPFLIGLIAIMFSGLCSWLNFTLLGMA